MSNPLENYLATKTAGPFDGAGGRLLSNARVGAEEAVGSAGAGLALTGLGIAAMKIYKAVRKKSDFEGMLQHNPDLAEFQSTDPKRFNAHYNSFRAMNPEFAEDPIISGTYMRQMSLNPHSAGQTIVNSMMDRQKSVPQSGRQLSIGSKRDDNSASFRFNV